MARLLAAASSQYLRTTTVPVAACPLTMAYFFIPTTFGVGVNFPLLGLGENTGNEAFQTDLSSGVYRAYQVSGGTGGIASTGVVLDGSTQHLAAVFTSNTSRTAFVNGGSKTTNTTSKSTPSGLAATILGKYEHSGSFFANGAFAEVGIWAAALDDAEVIALSKGVSPLQIRPQSLVAYWPLIGNDSPEPDRWRSRVDLTLTNAPAKASHVRVYAPMGVG